MLMVQSIYMLLFRILHIGAAVLWVGMVFFFAVFISPTAAKLGPAAFPVMKELVEERKAPKVIQAVAGFTVLGGLFLYWHDWQAYGTLGNFVGTPFGRALTIGAIAAISAFVVGNIFVARNVEKIVEVGSKVAASGGPPPSRVDRSDPAARSADQGRIAGDVGAAGDRRSRDGDRSLLVARFRYVACSSNARSRAA